MCDSPQAQFSSKHRLFLVRHAQRADEAPPGAPVHTSAGQRPAESHDWHDPPITELGAEQAACAARHIVRTLSEKHKFTAVYASPYTRCIQTAYPLAKLLNVPLAVEPALGVCAASFVRMKRSGKYPVTPSSLEELTRWMSDIPVEVLGTLADCKEDIVPALERIVGRSAASSNNVTLAVTHREGIRTLDAICGEKEIMSTPYCVVHEYEFERASNHWRLIHNSAVCIPEPRSKYESGQNAGRRRDREFAFSDSVECYENVPVQTCASKPSSF
jgi:broad specificity phosphatase PhoE